MKRHFIKATEEYNTFEKPVPAYYFRRSFAVSHSAPAKITIAVCGFYEIYLNGQKLTKGLLSPYISNPNHYVYYDEYAVTLTPGENVIGLWLGNGFQNNPGGYIWDFDKADFRSAPMFALTMTGEGLNLTSDTNFKTAPSPIRSDDYRFGECYDANFEIPGWNQPGFDDTRWQNVLPATAPKGELRPAEILPIVAEKELKPVSITPCGEGYLYDFGESNAGVCRLRIRGEKGQTVILQHADSLKDGDLDLGQIWFVRDLWERDKELVHKDAYVCKGQGTEIYRPTFTYHGFRYVKVSGITEQQATEELLTYVVCHTRLSTRGDFSCSDPMGNKLQEITRRSLLANFCHFPTDCPQREKNGWAADAALASEATLLNFDPETNYREWMRNICKAQREDGALPGIIPTTGWGFHWGNGPAWDCVQVWLPYYTYLYRGETAMIAESAETWIKYLQYLRSRADEKGLLAIGLGDWLDVGLIRPQAPLVVTDTITAMEIANKMAILLDAIGHEQATFARAESLSYRTAIREELVDASLWVQGECQASQAMALHYGVFDPHEEEAAFANLLKTVHDADDHMDVGMLGAATLFEVLTRFGHSDLAYRMITRTDYPSFGNWVTRGATTLWENFKPDSVWSMNHICWSVISAWFIKCVAGIRLQSVNQVKIRPSFVSALDNASAYHIAPKGRISASWHRQGDKILLDVEIPEGISATAELESGYSFADGSCKIPLTTGTYTIHKQ